jgi:hypothetical protein
VLRSEKGVQTAAMLYTMVGTCKQLGIDPFGYFREALPALFALRRTPGQAVTGVLAGPLVAASSQDNAVAASDNRESLGEVTRVLLRNNSSDEP